MPDIIQVAGIVLRNSEGRYLLVQEGLPQARGLWNLPAGHIDKGETPSQAALREAYEETGFKVKMVSPDPVLVDKDTEKGVKKYSYLVEIIGGELNFPKDELLDAKWLTYDEIQALSDQAKLRTSWVIDSIKCAENYNLKRH